jgi:hypothetical protein
MGYTRTQTTVTIGSNNRVNEISEITLELKITSQATNFIKPSFHMRRMVTFDVEISASVCAFLVNFGGQCRPFPDDQAIQKKNDTVRLCFRNKLD